MPSGICTTSSTPVAALALAPSKLLTLPPCTGDMAMVAYTMPGSLTSMPKRAVPLTLAGVSSRVVGLPTMRNCDAGFIAGFSGTGILAAASASWP